MKKTTNKILLGLIIAAAVVIFAGTIICMKITINNIPDNQEFYNDEDYQLTTSVSSFNEEFYAVKNNTTANVTIVKGETAEIKINATSFIFNHLTTIITDSVLIIDMSKCDIDEKCICEIEITMPKCSSIYNEGIGSIECNLLEGDNVKIENKGIGNITTQNIKCNNLIIVNEGIGRIVAGSVETELFNVDNEGVGDITVEKVKSNDSSITNEGVGHVEVKAIDTNLLTADNEGVGGIKIAGTAMKANLTNDGAGKINVTDLTCSDFKISYDGFGWIER